MNQGTEGVSDAATILSNLTGYRVLSAATCAFGQRRVRVRATAIPGCPDRGVVATRKPSSRSQRLRVSRVPVRLRFSGTGSAGSATKRTAHARRSTNPQPRFRSVGYFRGPDSNAWKRSEPWMPLQWRLGVQVVAINPSAAFRKALRIWLPRTAVAVDAFTNRQARQ